MRKRDLLAVLIVLGFYASCGGGNKGSSVDVTEPSNLTLLSASFYGAYDADGEWMAWTAFDKRQMLVYYGSTVIDLTASMDPKYDPLSSGFDGRYVVFLATDGIAQQVFYADLESPSVPVFLTDYSLASASFANPIVRDGLAVWSNWLATGDYEISYCDLTAPAPVVKRITNENSVLADAFPVTDGRYIAWEGKASDGTDQEVFFFDTANPGSGEIRLTENDFSDSSVRIDAGIIAWEADAAAVAKSSEIFTYVIGTDSVPSRLTSNTLSDSSPSVKDGVVSWTAVHPPSSNGDIHISDIINAPGSNIRITSNTYYESSVVSSGSVVAWEGSSTIYFYDLSEGASTAQPHTVWSGDMMGSPGPVLDGQDLVWEAWNYPDIKIYAYNTGAWPSTEVAVLANQSFNESAVQVGEGVTTWVEKGYSDPYNTYYTMYSHDLADPVGSNLVIIAQEHHNLFVETRTSVDGTPRAAWIPEGSLARLYAKKHNVPGDPVLVTPQNMAAGYIKVASGKLAWFGFDEGPGGQLYYTNLESSSMTVYQATTGSHQPYELDFDGTVIAWDEGPSWNRNIYYYDLSSPSPTVVEVTSSGEASFPRVDGGILAWVENDGIDNEIHFAKVGSPAQTVTDNDFDDEWPSISEGLVCWRGGPGTSVTQDIYCADVVDAPQEVIRVTSNDDYEGPPDVEGDIVVWISATGDSAPWSMNVCDIGSQEVFKLETSTEIMRSSLIENGLVTWHQGEFAWDDPPAEIHAQYLGGTSRTEIVNGGYNVYPKPGDGFLIWNLYINHLYMAEP